MIISKTPFRFSFFGGGCDYPGWFNRNESFVLTSAMDYHCFLMVRELDGFFAEYKSQASYSDIEKVYDNRNFQHPSIRECLNHVNYLDKRVSITHAGDLPSKSGIGSSSSFTVGLLKALKEIKNEKISNQELAKLACHVEQNLIGEQVGVQDQFASSLGGIVELKLNKNEIKAKHLILSKEYIKEIEKYILFGFAGVQRFSSDYTEELTKKIDALYFDTYLSEMNDISKHGIHNFKKESDIEIIGKYVDSSWNLKRQLDTGSAYSIFKDIYDVAKKNGAIGGKLMGAGGGGFFYLIANPKHHDKIKSQLQKIKIWVPFRFSMEGSQIINKSKELRV